MELRVRIGVKIRRGDGDDERAVRIFRVAAGITHPVDGKVPLLRGAVDNITSRTHAEGVHSPPVLGLMREFIRGGTDLPGSSLPVLGAVNHFLRVLYANTGSKGFRLEKDAFLLQHAECITGRVARREHTDIRRDLYGIIHDHRRKGAGS